MKLNRILCLVLFLMGAFSQELFAQASKKKPVNKTATKTPAKTQKPPAKQVTRDETQDEKKVRDMVVFLEFVLNTLGNASTTSRDKDVLVTETYSKIFRDINVQVEDDLDDEREISTNKNVAAYLKDVDFFFRDVHFEFTIEKIERGENATNRLFYTVSLKRNLKGTTSEGKAVNNTIPRFIEVNYDPVAQDLKIVSIYTHAIDEKEALIGWWKQQSLEWQTIFREKIGSENKKALSDTISIDDIHDIVAIQELDLSNNKYIQNIEPLARLTSLRVLNLSKTGVTDLTPIRNLTALVDLNLSYTKVLDLSALKYSDKIAKLNINNTGVSDLAVISRMQGLQSLDLRGTKVSDFGPLTGLTGLYHLNIAGTPVKNLSFLDSLKDITELDLSATAVSDLSPLKNSQKLATLNIDSTRISNLSPLAGIQALKVLQANHTGISDLQPLSGLKYLERIYCDKTSVTRATADAFMAANRSVLVVFDTQDMKLWWDALSGDWQEVFIKTARVGQTPGKDELAVIQGLDSINISESHIGDLEPLKKLLKLRVLIAHNSSITDLTPIKGLRQLESLDFSETDVTDISILDQLPSLKIVRGDKSKIQNIHSLFAAKSLQRLYVDETAIHDITAQEFLDKNPQCLLVYKTLHINRWWKRLPADWRQVFLGQMKDTTASRENLHRLVEQETLSFKESSVFDLAALGEFVRLKELHFSGTSITDLTPLAGFTWLKSIHATSSPIQQIESLRPLSGLTDLDISNTPIDDLRGIESLQNLKQLNCSGTQIKKLDLLKGLTYLTVLDCSNTRVSNLDPVNHRTLKTLKCYNSKVTTREIESFKRSNPDCNVMFYR